jgi:hypothetical protein
MKSLYYALYWSRPARWWRKGGGKCIGVDNSGDRMYTISNGEAFMIFAVCGIVAVAAIVAICCGIWRMLR